MESTLPLNPNAGTAPDNNIWYESVNDVDLHDLKMKVALSENGLNIESSPKNKCKSIQKRCHHEINILVFIYQLVCIYIPTRDLSTILQTGNHRFHVFV